MIKCPKCSNEIPKEANFCPYCMEKFVESEECGNISKKKNNKVIWIVLIISILIVGILLFYAIKITNNYEEAMKEVPKENTKNQESENIEDSSTEESTTPQETTPQETTPQETTPQETTPQETTTEATSTEITTTESNNEDGEINFSKDSKLRWPIEGDIIIDYSMNELVYFPTQDEYLHSDAILIEAEEGMAVYCAFDCVVSEISFDEKRGNYMKVDLGNGYSLVYGQMKDFSYQVGDFIGEGAVIGYINKTSDFFALEGCNLYFRMIKNGGPINPMNYLE